jgi:hypothetical protein
MVLFMCMRGGIQKGDTTLQPVKKYTITSSNTLHLHVAILKAEVWLRQELGVQERQEVVQLNVTHSHLQLE